MQLRVFEPGSAFGNPKRRVQAIFQFNSSDYALWVTDPNIARRYLKKDNGFYDLAESYLTISLSEPYEGYVYKLVAAILERS